MRLLLTVAVLLALGFSFAQDVSAQVREATSEELIERLADSDVERRRDAAYEIVRRQESSPEVIIALEKSLADNDTQVRVQSIIALTHAGRHAEPAIPGLLKCISDRDDQIWYRAANALGKIGPAAIAPLTKAWPDASERSQIAIAQALGIVGGEAKSALPLLTEALAKGKEGLPRYAAEAIVEIAPQDEAAFLTMAAHENPTVRKIGISALSAIAAPSESALNVLQKGVADTEPKIRETSVIALAKSKLPADAKSKLIEAALFDEVSSVRAASIVALRKADLQRAEFARVIAARLPDANADSANAIFKAIAALGADAKGTLPAVVAVADREGIEHELVALALASFGGDVVPDLLQAIEQHPNLEPVLSQSLGLIGEPAIDSLIKGMSSDSELIRVAAARAIGGVRPLTNQLIEKLASASEDKSTKVRKIAVGALIAAEKEASFAKDSILKSMQDSAPEVRAVAIQSLPTFGYSSEDLQVALGKGLADDIAEVKVSSILALGQLPKLHTGFADRLIALVSDNAPSVRKAAVQTLSKFDKDLVNESVVEACVRCLKDSDNSVRFAATETVKTLKISQPAVLEALAGNLVEDLELLRVSLDAISGFGDKASDLVPAVSNLVAHEKADIRASAVNALADIDQDKPRLVARLTEALEDKDWEVRRIAGVALGKLGADAKNAVPKLFTMLSNAEDADFANSSLREINTAPVEAIPLLLEKLNSEERRVSFYAVTLLGKIGPPAAEALPKLEALLADPDGAREASRNDFRRKFLRDAIASIKGEAVESDKK